MISIIKNLFVSKEVFAYSPKTYFLEEVFFEVEVLQEAEEDFFEQEEVFLLEDLQLQLFNCSTAKAQNSWSLPEGQPAFCHIK